MPAESGERTERAQIQSRDHHAHRVHVAGSSSSAFAEKDQRQLLLVGQFQHAVHFLVVEISLRAGQHSVVVSHDHAAGFVFGIKFAVYRGDSGDQTVGRRFGDQVVNGTASPLRGNGQRSVFNETFRIAEGLDVGAGGALILLFSFLHCVGAVFIQSEGMSADRFGQVGTKGSAVRFLLPGGIIDDVFVFICIHLLSTPCVY